MCAEMAHSARSLRATVAEGRDSIAHGAYRLAMASMRCGWRRGSSPSPNIVLLGAGDLGDWYADAL